MNKYKYKQIPVKVLLDLLDLAGNAIQSLPAGVFARGAQLRSLVLSRNQLDTVPSKGLAGVRRSLVQLRLDGNHIRTVVAQDFEGLGNLTHLSLADNNIEALEVRKKII
jgi:Leucine-rich repeat (LRR) protein